jgi:hypothetical protein
MFQICGGVPEIAAMERNFAESEKISRFAGNIGVASEHLRAVYLSGVESAQAYAVGIGRDIVGKIDGKPVDRADGRIRDGDGGWIA